MSGDISAFLNRFDALSDEVANFPVPRGANLRHLYVRVGCNVVYHNVLAHIINIMQDLGKQSILRHIATEFIFISS
jgi:hypothetical protein